MRYSYPARPYGCHEQQVFSRRYPGELKRYEGVNATIRFETSNAYIRFGGPQERYRPVLMLVGRIHGASFDSGDLPGGATSLRFDRDADKEFGTYTYQLSNRAIANMALKGLYEPGFTVPEIIKNNMFEIPAKCDVYAAETQDGDGKSTYLMYMHVLDGSVPGEENTLECSDEELVVDGRTVPGSGYGIADYFDAVVQREREDDLLKDDTVLEDYGYEDALKGEKEAYEALDFSAEEGPKVQQAEQPEEELPDVDEEMYAAMKAGAEATLKSVAKGLGANAFAEAEPVEELDASEGPEVEDDLIDFDDEYEDDAAKQRQNLRRVKTNQAENIDTAKELLDKDQAETVGAFDAQVVDKETVQEAADELADASRASVGLSREVDTSAVKESLADQDTPDY